MEQTAAVAVRGLDSFLTHWEQRQQMANILIKSRFLPPAYQTPEQVIATMLVAHELNVPEMEAIRGINIIQGKPTISPQLMLALINRSGQLEDMTISDDGETCTVGMKRRGRSLVSVSFSNKDAVAMQLATKDNWKKQPKVMRQWRAVSACARVVFPDVISGMYTTEEIDPDATITDDGEQIPSKIEVAQVVESLPTEGQREAVNTVEPEVVEIHFNRIKEAIAAKTSLDDLAKAWKGWTSQYVHLFSAAQKAELMKAKDARKVELGKEPEKPAEPSPADPLGTLENQNLGVADDIFGKPQSEMTEKEVGRTNLRKGLIAIIRSAKTKKTLDVVTKQLDEAMRKSEITQEDWEAVMEAMDLKEQEFASKKPVAA